MTRLLEALRRPGAAAAIGIPLALVAIVLLLVVPLPALLLDLLLAASISLSIAILMVAIQVEKPVEFSAFPTVLLFGTLLRLALNVASTRRILLHGAEGTDAAGGVIQAFGEFVVGSNYVVGLVLFLLLVLINFVVVTKGAGRVAEVSARFVLDALPGKQMSVDADLSSGVIGQDEARARRRAIEQEADFYGAMDGASKFVRGDAIAALLITGINIVGGLVVGVVQNDMAVGDAAATYTVLTVGEGLAAQIPALLVSTAAGVIVTRSAAGSGLSAALVRQLGQSPRALGVTAAVLFVLALLPGMPTLPFLALGAGFGWFASRKRAEEPADGPSGVTAAAQADPTAVEKARIEEMLPVDLLSLEVGLDLVPLVDPSQGGELVERIGAIRRNLAADLGIIVPQVHVRDNLRLRPQAYRLLLSGNEIAQGELRPARMLAMDPTGAAPPIDGERVREPAFGLPARWIATGDRERAESAGYTVVDAPTVAATHVTETLRQCAPDLLGRAEAQEILDLFAKKHARLVDELIPNLLPLGEVIKVLRGLLREGIPIRDLRTIFEALADQARETKDPDELCERVRERLARHITQRLRGDDGRVAALVLDPKVEDAMRAGPLEPVVASQIIRSLETGVRAFAAISTPPVILVSPDVRRVAAAFFGRRVPGLGVVSYREIDPKAQVRNLGVVGLGPQTRNVFQEAA